MSRAAKLNPTNRHVVDPTHQRVTEVMPGGRVQETAGGRLLVRIIDAGVGSSGVYPAATLQEAATSRVFPAGTHCYIDHAAAAARGPNGERSIRDLAAVLAEDARWDAATESLVAEAAVFGHTELGDRGTLRELLPHIGMSISAYATLEPSTVAGEPPVVTQLVAAESVDFVVKAGRGGAILELLEASAGWATEAPTEDRRAQLYRAVRAKFDTNPADDSWVGVADFDDAARIVWYHATGQLWQQTYVVADDDLSVTLTGSSFEVRPVTSYIPVDNTGTTQPEPTEENRMAITQAEYDAAVARAEAAEAALAEVAREKLIMENRAEVARRVAAAVECEHPAIAARVQAMFTTSIDDVLPDDLDVQITTAVEAEKQYAARLAETRLTGFGPSTTTPDQTLPARTHNAFGRKI